MKVVFNDNLLKVQHTFGRRVHLVIFNWVNLFSVKYYTLSFVVGLQIHIFKLSFIII